MSWINHLPPACWSTFWKSNFKQQLGCRFDIMDNESYFFVFWHMQLYMSWYIRSFFGFTFLIILYFFKHSCANIFHRRSLYTFYSNTVSFCNCFITRPICNVHINNTLVRLETSTFNCFFFSLVYSSTRWCIQPWPHHLGSQYSPLGKFWNLVGAERWSQGITYGCFFTHPVTHLPPWMWHIISLKLHQRGLKSYVSKTYTSQ